MFPILNLPTVALEELLKNYTPLELLLLSQVSKRMSQIISLAGTKNFSLDLNLAHGRVEVNIDYHLGMYLIDHGIEFDWKLGDQNRFAVVYSEEEKVLACHWEQDEYKELGKSALHLSKLFKCPISSFMSKWDLTSEENLELIKEVVGAQNGRIKCMALMEGFEMEHLQWILENVEVTKRLQMHTSPKTGLQVTSWSDCEDLDISGVGGHTVSWFTFEHFMALKSCKKVKLMNLNLIFRDIDSFLQEWNNGAFPNLEILEALDRGTFEDTLLGRTEDELKIDFQEIITSGRVRWVMSAPVEIESGVGTKASYSVYREDDSFKFELTVKIEE